MLRTLKSYRIHQQLQILSHRCLSQEKSDHDGGGTDERILNRVLHRLERRGGTVDRTKRRVNNLDEKDIPVNSEHVHRRNNISRGRGGRPNKLQELVGDTNNRFSDRIDDIEYPSDVEKFTNASSLHPEISDVEPVIDPALTSSIIFPGQGSQFVGMGQELLSYPKVEKLYEQASDILGYDLLNLCLLGPKTKLDLTVYCQPAVFVTSVAAIEKLRAECPDAVNNCVSTAGFSVGEYASLVLAESLSFVDALRVVKVRAEAMQSATEDAPSGMMTIFERPSTQSKLACAAAIVYCKQYKGIEKPVCSVANYLFTECKVIAGHNEALDFITENKADFGIHRMKRLPVSGAFHTELMRSAREPVKRELKSIQISPPKMKVYSNVTGQVLSEGNIREMLLQQIYKPVKWERTMQEMYSRPGGQSFPSIFELGPGNQLGIMLKKVNSKAGKDYAKIEV